MRLAYIYAMRKSPNKESFQQTPWYLVFRKLAGLIQQAYSVKLNESPGRLLYTAALSKSEFVRLYPWVKQYKKQFSIDSIDPIAVFASLNETRMDPKKRYQRINALFRLLGSSDYYDFDSINFDGCPSPFSIKIRSARRLEEQNQIWKAFIDIMQNRQDALTEEMFEEVKHWYGVGIPSFTMFLFWIDAHNFMPLDSKTEELLVSAGIITHLPRTVDEYLEILADKNTNIYIDIAHGAQYLKPKTPEYEEALIRFAKLYSRETTTRVIINLPDKGDFRLIGMRIHDDCNKALTKVFAKKMPSGGFYSFYQAFQFESEGNIVKYDKTRDHDIYSVIVNEKRIPVYLSAIVGKNGSGKSTMTELLYAAISNISCLILGNLNDKEWINQLHLDLYFHSNTLQCIRLNGTQISHCTYTFQFDKYVKVLERAADIESMRQFFYSVVNNYSHYGLNDSEPSYTWLTHLFLKNDGYQIPIAINPMRNRGNFDINKENKLVKDRLLANLLTTYDNESDSSKLRQLTMEGRYASEVLFSLDIEKINAIELHNKKYDQRLIERTVSKLFFNNGPSLKPSSGNEDLRQIAGQYIFYKITKIVAQYEPYKGYRDLFPKGKRKNRVLKVLKKPEKLKKLFEDLWKDPSHVVYKYKQAVNYLHYRHWDKVELNKRQPLKLLHTWLKEVEIKNEELRDAEPITLIPPSFLLPDIFLNDNSPIKELSSGEKQWIYTIHSVIYHINYINSVREIGNQIKYRHINLVFDEIELYFHPDMQRMFVDQLLKFITHADLENIRGINVSFVTHSPFILSDIPHDNLLLLRLPEEVIEENDRFEEQRTLGANIHELLRSSFFMKNGLMGEYVKKKIQSVINYLNKPQRNNPDWNEQSSKQFINLIGESMLRLSLLDMHNRAFLKRADQIDKEIAQLQELKKERVNNRKKFEI